MRIAGLGRASAPGTGRRRIHRFRRGERVEASVVRRLLGPFHLIEIDGLRLVAWVDPPVESESAMYLEVVAGAPSPRFRRLTGGAAFWSLPVGRTDRSELDTHG